MILPPTTSPTGVFAEVALGGLGVRLVLRLTGDRAPELHERVLRAWDRCLVPDGPGDARGVVQAPVLEVCLATDAAELTAARTRGAVASDDVDDLLHHLSPAVTLRLIEARAGSLMMLHACALAHPATGRVTVLVAPSGTGKTTLSRTLGRDFGYLTDETAGVDEQGRLLAYPKPLSVIPTPGAAVKQQVSPSEYGLRAAPVGETRIGALVLLERDPEGPDAPEVTPEPTVRALAALATQTSYLDRIERPLHRLAAVVEQAGGLRRVRYRESATLAPLLAEWTGSGA